MDVWLFAARFFKTRALAVDAIRNGRVRWAGERCKPARLIQVGDVLSVQRGAETFVITVQQTVEKRPSASLAAEFYCESAESQAARMQVRENMKLNRELIDYPQHKPNKKDRRRIIAFQKKY